MNNKKGNKKQKKIVGGYYKKEVDPVKPKENYSVEISSEDEEEELPDFTFLSKHPVSAQSHFILNSEQKRFEGDSIISYSKYFNVDVKLLNASIKSVPFNEIHEIRGVQWTQDELDQMNQISHLHEEQYKKLLNKSTKVVKVPQSNSQLVEKKVEELKESSPAKSIQTNKEEIDSSNRASMEKWLDDILDI